VEISDRAVAYRGPLLHFIALRILKLHEGGRTEETLATENEGKCLHANLHACTLAHAAHSCWGKLAAHTQPTLRTGLTAPAWCPALCILGVILDLLSNTLTSRNATRYSTKASYEKMKDSYPKKNRAM